MARSSSRSAKHGRKKRSPKISRVLPEVAWVHRHLIEGIVASRLPDEHPAAFLNGAVERERVGKLGAATKQHVLHEVRKPVAAHLLVARAGPHVESHRHPVQVGRLDRAHAQTVGQAMVGHAPGEGEEINGGGQPARIAVGQVGQDSAGL